MKTKADTAINTIGIGTLVVCLATLALVGTIQAAVWLINDGGTLGMIALPFFVVAVVFGVTKMIQAYFKKVDKDLLTKLDNEGKQQ